jgi:beta-galactosidase
MKTTFGRFFFFSFLIALSLITFPLKAQQPYKFDDILYGAAYYHEYMPYERLDEDIRLMKEAGINYVRMGESTWQLWEPREGEFEYAWMDRVVDKMHKAGIKIIMGTPTYSIPAWLYRKHPEICALQENGQRLKYGIRQNTDFSNPTYLFYCERIIVNIIDHYKNHQGVIGYQIDNETHTKWPTDKHDHLSYIDYLKKKFKSVDTINKIWGFNYWGQAINDWDELHPPDGFNHPGYRLEWMRYQQKVVKDFLTWQSELVRKHKGAGQFIMHDFAGALRSDLDQRGISKATDYDGVNIYHYDQDRSDGLRITMQGDFTRSLKRSNYLVPETNAQGISWDSRWQFPPYDGQLRLNYYSHIGSGANLVSYWHWSTLHSGIEQYWRGVLTHDLQPGRIYNEVKIIGNERIKIGKKIVNLQKKNRVAILFSDDSDNGINLQKFDNNLKAPVTGPWDPDGAYQKVLNKFYKALYDLNIESDFVFDDGKNFEKYDILIVPPLYIASDELLKKLVAYVKNGGHLVLTLKSGFCDENSKVRHIVMPGLLSEITGFTYQEFSNLKGNIPLKGDPFNALENNYVEQWAEFIVPKTAKPLAFYDHPFFAKYPAITRNDAGKGSVTYFGTIPSEAIIQKIIRSIADERKITGPDQQLPEKIKVKHGTGNNGKKLHFYYNFSDKEQSFVYAYESGTNVLSDDTVNKNGSLKLSPWGVAIVEEK